MDIQEELLLSVQELNDLMKYNEVLELLSESKLDNFKNADLFTEKGIAYLGLKRNTESNNCAEKALSINSEQVKAINIKGRLCIKNNEPEKAIEFFKRSIELDKSYLFAYDSLGSIYNDLKLHDIAIEYYNKAIEINPSHSFAYQGLGNVYHNLNLFDKAIKYFAKSIEMNSTNSSAYNGLGCAYLEQKKFDKAIELFNKAIELSPDYASPFCNLGLIYYINKDYNRALIYYVKYLELESESTSIFIPLVTARVNEINKFLVNEKYKDISELVNKIKELLIFKDESITHYTGLSAAKALILDNSKFRLSEGAFLNDTSEGRELFRHLSIPVSRKFQDTESILFAQKPFIGSFVTETKHDDLTLWRMYGKEDKDEAKGCAITIDLEGLLMNIKDLLTSNISFTDTAGIFDEFTFYRVAYRKPEAETEFIIPGAEEKEQVLKEYMIELAKKVKKFTPTKEEEKSSENKDLIERLNEIAYLFKSAEYQHENEIRLVVKGIGFEKVIDGKSPKVYLELVPIRPLIKKITLGPKVDKAEEWAAAFYYSLDKDGLQPCIHISHLPYK